MREVVYYKLYFFNRNRNIQFISFLEVLIVFLRFGPFHLSCQNYWHKSAVHVSSFPGNVCGICSNIIHLFLIFIFVIFVFILDSFYCHILKFTSHFSTMHNVPLR